MHVSMGVIIYMNTVKTQYFEYESKNYIINIAVLALSETIFVNLNMTELSADTYHETHELLPISFHKVIKILKS